MKHLLPRIGVLALGLILVFTAASANGDSLPLPLEKKVAVGETIITYAGQTLRFNTSVPLLVRLEPLSVTQIQYKVKVHPGFAIPSGPAGSSENNLTIFWVNIGTGVYDGGAPSGTLEGVLNTEGGFVDR